MRNQRSKASCHVLLLAVVSLALLPGCPKKPAVKPAAGEVLSKSYTIRTYGYRMNFAVKTTPEEIEDYFIKDLSWTSSFSSRLSFKVTDQSHGRDMSLPGAYIDTVVRYLGLNVPCRIVNLKYHPAKELWLMMLSGDAWTIMRLEIKPSPAGSVINLVTLGNVSESTARLMDSLELAKVAAAQLDYAMAVIQAQFDPTLDPKKLTEQGLRGELFEKPFQAYEAEAWINVSPEKAIARGLDQENFRAIIGSAEIGGIAECLYATENHYRWDPSVEYANTKGDFIYCPDTSVKIAGINWDTDTFAVIKPDNIEDFLNFYITVSNIVAQMELMGKPENGGTRVWLRVIVEPPAANLPNLMEAFMAIAGIPQWTRDLLIQTRSRIEGAT